VAVISLHDSTESNDSHCLHQVNHLSYSRVSKTTVTTQLLNTLEVEREAFLLLFYEVCKVTGTKKP